MKVCLCLLYLLQGVKHLNQLEQYEQQITATMLVLTSRLDRCKSHEVNMGVVAFVLSKTHNNV